MKHCFLVIDIHVLLPLILTYIYVCFSPITIIVLNVNINLFYS